MTEKINYDSTALDIINSSKILQESDLNVLTEYKEELRDTFLYSQIFRTRTEMEVSVLNDTKFPTPDSKYWQCVREQGVMFNELVNLSYEYRKNIVQIKKLQRQLEKEEDDLEKELIQIEIERLQFASVNQERVAKDRIREINEWHIIKQRLLPEMSYSVKDVDEHQLLSYTHRFIRESQVMGDNGSPSENINLIGQLKMALKTVDEKGLMTKLLEPYGGSSNKQLESYIERLLIE